MHPWTLQRLAEERRHEFELAAGRARSVHGARPVGPVVARTRKSRATRYLGEVLIRTGWRLVGAETPASGVRPRLALGGPVGAAVDPC